MIKYLVASTLLLVGCARLLHQDFDKATFVGELQLGSTENFRRAVQLPAGNARLIVAIHDYRCAPIDDAIIDISAHGKNVTGFSERVSLSQLTWSYGEGSCHAYGYLTGNNQNSEKSTSAEMRMQITRNKTQVIVDVDMSQIKTSSFRVASIWFIYGDRVPARKIFGDSK